MASIRVTVWNEYLDEKTKPLAAACYPEGIHTAVARALDGDPGLAVRAATLQEPCCGLRDEVLAATDVLFWWGHSAHEQVPWELADKIAARVHQGMGLVALHSGLFSRPVQRLIGTRMGCRYREVGERERMWVVDASHPLAKGLGPYIHIPQAEMYGEPTGLADPDELVFISWFQGGEVLRSGGCYHRGQGRVVYLTPGHEEYPTYHLPEMRQLLRNAAHYAWNPQGGQTFPAGETAPEEDLPAWREVHP